jgi:hypothetical protein
MSVLQATLSKYEAFFKENSEAFLNMRASTGATNLPTLQQQLHSGILILIDCKRAAQREILYSKLNGQDFSKLTHLAKSMLASLHGLGLSVIMEKDYLNCLSNDPLLKEATSETHEDYSSGFEESVALMKSSSEQLVEATVACLGRCKASLASFQPPQRTNLNIYLWPFPRILSLGQIKHSQDLDIMNEARDKLNDSLEQLNKALESFDQTQSSNGLERYYQICHQKDQHRTSQLESSDGNLVATTYGPLYLVFLYQNNIREYSAEIQSLATLVLQFHQKRTSRKIHLPQISLRKWFSSTNEVDPTLMTRNNGTNTDTGTSSNNDTHMGEAVPNAADLSLVQTTTRTDPFPTEKDAENGFVRSGNNNNNNNNGNSSGGNMATTQSRGYSRLYMDPDVSPPTTTMERFFNGFYKIFVWLKDIDTTFALKSAVGMVMLAIPAWMPENAGWFNDWRGNVYERSGEAIFI